MVSIELTCHLDMGSMGLVQVSQDLLGQVLCHLVPGGTKGPNHRRDGAAKNASRDVAGHANGYGYGTAGNFRGGKFL